jgi:hypothetical protein
MTRPPTEAAYSSDPFAPLRIFHSTLSPKTANTTVAAAVIGKPIVLLSQSPKLQGDGACTLQCGSDKCS